MVKRTITISTIILIISIIAGLIIVLNKTSFAAGEIATGTFGECSWVIDSNGTLTISPTNGTSGMMGNSTENSADSIPWFSYRSRIKELKFTGTVYANDYCNYLFSRCSNLRYADCTNFNTDNSTHMEQLFSYSGITKFTFGNNFKFIVSQTGMISDGMWLKEGTGQEYTASEIMRGVVGSLAGTYTKTKNIAEGLEVTEVITYKVNINSPVTWNSTNTDIFKNEQVLYYPLPEEEVGSDYQIEGPIIVTYKNAAEKADGSKYDLKVTIDNMHLYDYHRNSNNDKYIALFRLSNCEIENIICKEDFSSRVGVNVNYDIKMQIVDSNGNAQQGTFVFSAYDIDVSDLTGEFNSPFSEGINFLQGIDVNAIQTARYTVLVREGNRIRGSCLDGATEASMVLAIANASNTTIKWTAGKPCGTAFLKRYNPTSVQMQKVTNKGATLTGAGLKLYRGTELIDSWTSTTTPKSFWLNTGTYTLKETSVPNGYYKASDYTIFVEADGSLIVNGNAATSVEMVDQAKSFNVTYSYTGNPPATASTLPAQTAYEYKDLVTVAPNATAPGYTFSGWSRTGSFIMPANNVSITGSFTVKTNTPYKIEHYTEDLNANSFSLRETENKTGTTDTTATATAKTYTGFTYDGTISGTLTSGNIAGDGSLVLKLYYKRNSYNVSYSYTSAPVSASLLPADQTYEYGATVTVANNATAPGYTFSGWSRTGTFNMPAQNVEITGGFTANTNTPYKVEHYQKDINSNTYSLKDTENKTGVTDNTATATPKTYEGFTFNLGASTTNGIISGDGNFVLKLYYDRNSHTVSYAYQGTIPNGASALPTSSTYEYGATVTVAQNASAPGYTFSGWNKPATFTMPNENVIIKGSFLSDSNTTYTVEHYWEDLNENTYTLHETENLTGETDTDVTATPNSYAGFTYNSGLSTPTGTIAGVGNLVLKLYYNRNSYTVSYAYLGTVPTGASSLPSNTTHEFGDTVLVAADAEAPGYTFNGWNRTGTFNMPAQDVEIIGGFTANTDTPYKVEHYQKDLNSNTYTLKETDNKTGVTDNIVTETPKNYEGFTFDSGASTIRGRVSSDGNLVLKLYYTRNSYEVSYAYTSAPVSANLLPADHTYEYEAEVTVEPNAEALGYTFSGWSRTGTFNMPAQDVEITGGFTANTDTPYKVEHYQKEINSNTYSLKDTENKTGVTDNLITATPMTYEGFTFNSGTSITSGDISGDGNLVLQLYYDRNLHTVSYAYQGEMPTGVSNLPENEFYEYGATVTVAPDATAPGYTFNGWSRTGTFNMPAQDVEITGNFTANITTAYKIEHYIEDLNANTFSIRETENKTGTTDTMAITTPKTYEGFTYDVTIAGTLTSGNIAGDGSLVLKLYYTRNKYTYSIEYYFNGIIDESLIEDGEETLFGEEVSINPTQKTKHNNKNFVLASEDNKTTITATTDNNKIKVYYELDEAVDGEDKEEGGDGIPDKYQIVIYYEVENGKWNDGSTKKKVNIVTLKEDEEYSENGTGRANIPEVGTYPNEGYKEGAWEETPKVIVNKANDGITYKYVFERKETQNEGENEENPSNTQNNSDKDEGNTSDNNKPKETKESDVKDAKNESANPKTADKIQKYFAYGMVALILLSIAIRIGRKYGRKRRKIQY